MALLAKGRLALAARKLRRFMLALIPASVHNYVQEPHAAFAPQLKSGARCEQGERFMQRIRLLLTHATVVIMAALCALAIVVLAVFGPLWVWALVPLGVLAQYLNEYNLHRYVFHLKPPKSQWAFNLLYRAHYGHHDFPTNFKLFFVPLWVALPMLACNFLGLWALLHLFGLKQALWIALAVVPVGGVATFLGYEWFHMSAHLNVPKGPFARYVTKLHNQHHFRDFSKWFHVSPGGEIIDRIMGTAIERDALKAQQRIEFIRTLGMRPDDPRLVTARTTFADKYHLSSEEITQAARG